VIGETVEPRQARVLELSREGREAELEFIPFSDL
jgi:hypothetical protein